VRAAVAEADVGDAPVGGDLAGVKDEFRYGLRMGKGHDDAEAAGRHVGRPVAHPAEKIEYTRLLRGQGHTLGAVAAQTGIPTTSLHRYLAVEPVAVTPSAGGRP